MIVTFSNFSGVVWKENILDLFRVKKSLPKFSWALNFECATTDVFPLTALPSLAKHLDVLVWYDFQLVGLHMVAGISGICS